MDPMVCEAQKLLRLGQNHVDLNAFLAKRIPVQQELAVSRM
jgi:hypothetical protein